MHDALGGVGGHTHLGAESLERGLLQGLHLAVIGQQAPQIEPGLRIGNAAGDEGLRARIGVVVLVGRQEGRQPRFGQRRGPGFVQGVVRLGARAVVAQILACLLYTSSAFTKFTVTGERERGAMFGWASAGGSVRLATSAATMLRVNQVPCLLYTSRCV